MASSSRVHRRHSRKSVAKRQTSATRRRPPRTVVRHAVNKLVHDLMVAGKGHELRVLRYRLLAQVATLVKAVTKNA